MSLMQQEYHWGYYIIFLISKYWSRDQQSMLTINAPKMSSTFFSAPKSIYLKYLQYLQSGHKFEISIQNDIWLHVFRSEVGLYIFIFLITYLVYSLFLIVCGNFPLTLNTGMCWNLLWFDSRLNWINPIKNIISCLIKNGDIAPNLKYYLENYFEIT